MSEPCTYKKGRLVLSKYGYGTMLIPDQAPDPYIEPEPKVKATSIMLSRAEGMHAECYDVAVKTDMHATCWQHADCVLRQWAATAPEGGAYDKCDFTVTYADGDTYSGRYDLQRNDMARRGILAEHIDSFTGMYAFEVWPAWIEADPVKKEDFKRHVLTQEGVHEQYVAFRAKYEIGDQ